MQRVRFGVHFDFFGGTTSDPKFLFIKAPCQKYELVIFLGLCDAVFDGYTQGFYPQMKGISMS
jgi:hypothetical protein